MVDESTEFTDVEIKCIEADCETVFIHTAGEQRWMREKFGDDYNAPKRCHTCRKKKKQQQP